MKVYIVDIDGTVANIQHRLHHIKKEPADWDAFNAAIPDDTPIQEVIDVVNSLPHPIVFVTGRNESSRKDTNKQLNSFGLLANCISLFMRVDGDRRPDTEIKKEIYQKIVGEYQCKIVGVFEDRVSVVKMWRELGLTVFQMTHEEF